jgi:photosystem I P700 chlorophyll a apoprotein A1
MQITSGIFNIWVTHGIGSLLFLKTSCAAAGILMLTFIFGSFTHSHINFSFFTISEKIRSMNLHHLVVLASLGSVSWAGHTVHISFPSEITYASKINPSLSPWPSDLLKFSVFRLIVGSSVFKCATLSLCSLVRFNSLLITIHHLFISLSFSLSA